MVMRFDGSAPEARFSRTKLVADAGIPSFAAVPLLLGEWTGDGTLLFAATEMLPNGYTKWVTDLWALPRDGGPAIRTGLSAPGLRDIRTERAGRRIVYTSNSEHSETWVLHSALGNAADFK
jgi:hypothetical protein